MRFRYLRIAFSATCLIACVLLIVLWVRSYWWMDAVEFPLTSVMHAEIESAHGSWLILANEHGRPVTTAALHSVKIPDSDNIRTAMNAIAPFGLSFNLSYDSLLLCSPQSIPVFITAVLSVLALPCLRWRFRLRTMLIATTLISVLLGAIGWVNR